MSILIKNGIIVTVDGEDRVVRDGAIYIEDDKIVDIGPTTHVAKKYKAEKEVNAHWKLIIPGLINAHVHLVSSLGRGLGTDMDILEWLKKFKWPIQSRLTGKETYIGALMGCLESIRFGTTCVTENYYPPRNRKRNIDRVAEAIEKSGMRGILARGYHDKEFMIPEVFVEDKDEVLKEYERIIRSWHGKADGRIMTWVSPVNLLFSTPESVIKVHELAKKHGVGMHTHIAEGREEVELVKNEYGKGYVEIFYDLGVMGPNFHAAHAVWVSDKEISLMARTNSRVVHNPTSNMYLASGTAPVTKMLKAGVTVALGTDSACSNNNLDMVQALKFAALLQKVHSLDPTTISAREVLKMATINGARALGLEKEIGSLEVGKKADITIINLWKPNVIPLHDPIANLVYSASGSNVETVIIDGKIVMENNIVKTFDEEETLRKVQKTAVNLLQGTTKRAYISHNISLRPSQPP